jgi:flagellar motor switch protein FliM
MVNSAGAEMTSSETVIRRKLKAAHSDASTGAPGADRAWRLALARAARDAAKLPLDVTRLTIAQSSLAEVLELPPDRGMIVILEGPQEAIGLFLLSNAVLASLVEIQTIGQVVAQQPAARKPTRTDAAMSQPMIDDALIGLEAGLADQGDYSWASGFRFASFIEDPRPLGLLLEDVTYRVLTAQVSLAHGARKGEVFLVLPAGGVGAAHHQLPLPDAADQPETFRSNLLAQVEGADCTLQAVMARVTMPLNQLMQLAVNQQISLPMAAIDRISLEGMDGRHVATARLGQQNGMRALRVHDQVAQGAASQRANVFTDPATQGVTIFEPDSDLRKSA